MQLFVRFHAGLTLMLIFFIQKCKDILLVIVGHSFIHLFFFFFLDTNPVAHPLPPPALVLLTVAGETTNRHTHTSSPQRAICTRSAARCFVDRLPASGWVPSFGLKTHYYHWLELFRQAGSQRSSSSACRPVSLSSSQIPSLPRLSIWRFGSRLLLYL